MIIYHKTAGARTVSEEEGLSLMERYPGWWSTIPHEQEFDEPPSAEPRGSQLDEPPPTEPGGGQLDGQEQERQEERDAEEKRRLRQLLRDRGHAPGPRSSLELLRRLAGELEDGHSA